MKRLYFAIMFMVACGGSSVEKDATPKEELVTEDQANQKESKSEGSLQLENIGSASPDTDRTAIVPRMRMGRPKSDTDSAIVGRLIRRNKDGLMSCYETVLAEAPEASGKITIEFGVSPEGSLEDFAVTSSTFEGDAMSLCVTEHAKTWERYEHEIKHAEVPVLFSPK